MFRGRVGEYAIMFDIWMGRANNMLMVTCEISYRYCDKVIRRCEC
jgi:hypothetical protein